ncbi:T9SS type A sorting domain-containing protein [bacterium]|nr:T9SS type A sorting domain-containing protein [bacterium]
MASDIVLKYPKWDYPDNFVDKISNDGGRVVLISDDGLCRVISDDEQADYRIISSSIIFGAFYQGWDSQGYLQGSTPIELMQRYVEYLLKGRSAVSDDQLGIDSFRLLQNYPNPFNSQTILVYELDRAMQINLAIYDIRGRLVELLINRYDSPGSHQYTFEGNDLPSGIYFAVLQSSDGTLIRKQKLILQK